jgi:putative ABC transport system permease protein
MNLLALCLAYIRARPLNAALNLLLLGLGVGTMVILILFAAQLEERLVRDARGIDLVIGAKGSPLQLILSSIYHIDFPTGNIPLDEAERWRGHPLVAEAIPIALGDSLAGFRIVGTEPAYAAHYGAELEAGRLWEEPFEVTLGAMVAARTGLKIGDRFAGSHGLAAGGPVHAEETYTVVGILAPSASALDRLVLTPIESVWLVHGMEPEAHEHSEEGAESAAGAHGHEEPHGHEEEHEQEEEAGLGNRPLEITSLLVRYRTPLGAVQLPRLVNQESALQAASPAIETTRLLSLVGVGLDTLRGFGLLLIGAAGLSVFIALSNAMQERRYDLALMRTLGATRRTLLAQLLLEGLLMATGGALLGLVLGHGAAEIIGRLVPSAQAMGLSGLAWRIEETYVIGLALGIGLLAALLPAFQAYRTDIAAVLSSRA